MELRQHLNLTIIKLALFLSVISASSQSSGISDEIIVTGTVGGTGPTVYIIDFQGDWVKAMNYDQLMQHQARERERQAQQMQQQSRERNLRICLSEATANQDACIFRANINRQQNMEKCGQLVSGISITLTTSNGGPGASFSSSAAYGHCTGMANVYFSSAASGCTAIASFQKNACEREN